MIILDLNLAVSRLRRLIDGLTAEMLFDAMGVRLRFVVDKVALRQVLLPVLLFSPVSTTPPMPHTPSHLLVALTRRSNGPNLELSKRNALPESVECWIENYIHLRFRILI